VRLSVEEMFREGVREPVSEELLREAEAQPHANPRSSLLLAVAAAEIGFKELVADLVPGAEWLALNLQSPPLVKMLKEYLPMLPVRVGGPALPPPKPIPQILDDAVRRRNELSHRGDPVGIKASPPMGSSASRASPGSASSGTSPAVSSAGGGP
jgi:hypothetical protein